MGADEASRERKLRNSCAEGAERLETQGDSREEPPSPVGGAAKGMQAAPPTRTAWQGAPVTQLCLEAPRCYLLDSSTRVHTGVDPASTMLPCITVQLLCVGARFPGSVLGFSVVQDMIFTISINESSRLKSPRVCYRDTN